MIFIGIDDTDTLQSRGTGRLARQIAGYLAEQFTVLGVTRHQLLVDPQIPYTKNNSSAAIHLISGAETDLQSIFEQVRQLMLADFQEGSDPGLCVAANVPSRIREFGHRAKLEVLDVDEALQLAEKSNILLAGLGGTQAGRIGALAAVGLASTGEDGRFIQIGRIRELSGLMSVESALAAGIASIQTLEGTQINSGYLQGDKLRPSLRNGSAVLYVSRQEQHWQPLKLD